MSGVEQGPGAGDRERPQAVPAAAVPPVSPPAGESILIVRLSAVGDCVHALPAVAALRAAKPGAKIVWAIDDRSAALFAGHPDVDEFLVMPRRGLKGRSLRERWRFALDWRRRLRAGGFAAAVDFQGLLKSALTARLAGAPLCIGLRRAQGARELSWLLYNCRPEVPESVRHVAERSLALLAPLGVRAGAELPLPRLPVHPAAAARVEAELGKLDLAGRRLAVFNPGAGWETKRWPANHFAVLAEMLRRDLGLEVLVTWFGPAERELAGRICAAGVARLAPPTDLPELLELLRRAALYIGADTGPTHIAAAAGTPTVALFGAADPVRNRPLGPRVETLTAGLHCSPCWLHRNCPRDVECMKALGPGAALAAARQFAAAPTAPAASAAAAPGGKP